MQKSITLQKNKKAPRYPSLSTNHNPADYP
jgi:hypothetical protein